MSEGKLEKHGRTDGGRIGRWGTVAFVEQQAFNFEMDLQIVCFLFLVWALIFSNHIYIPSVFIFMARMNRMAGRDFMWPRIPMELFSVKFTWSLLGYNVLQDARDGDWQAETSAMRPVSCPVY